MLKNQNRLNFSLLVLRCYTGVAFMFHGWPKMQNPFAWMGPDTHIPSFLLVLAALSEYGGGFVLILGVLTRLGALGILCTMTVAIATHLIKGDPFVGYGASWDLAAAYWIIAFTLICAGPGEWSFDALIFSKKKHK